MALYLKMLTDRKMPDPYVNQSLLKESGLRFGTFDELKREYVLLTIPAYEAAVAVHIGAKGNDLLMAWTLLIKPRMNWLFLSILGGSAFILALPIESAFASINRAIAWGGGSGHSFGMFLFAFMAISAILSLITYGVGQMTGMNLFIRELSLFELDDIRSVTIAAHRSLLQTADEAGITVDLLRMKQQFYGDFRDRVI